MSVPLNFYIDVSGQPKGEIFVGISSININYMSKFLSNLKKKHPEFIRNKQKGCNLKPNKIKSFVTYFNGNNLHMCCVVFKRSSWNLVKTFLKNKKYSKEMVYATLYFLGLKEFSKKRKSYQVVVCQENYLDIEKVKSYIKKLGKANNYDYQVSSSYASQNDMIKVSDLVAAATRKIKDKELLLLENYKVLFPNKEDLKFYLNKLKK